MDDEFNDNVPSFWVKKEDGYYDTQLNTLASMALIKVLKERMDDIPEFEKLEIYSGFDNYIITRDNFISFYDILEGDIEMNYDMSDDLTPCLCIKIYADESYIIALKLLIL